MSDHRLRKATDLAYWRKWLCWSWRCSISLQLPILIMVKKFFLSFLAAAAILPLPLSVYAVNAMPGIFPLSLAASNKPLSVADRDSVKKEITDLIKAINDRDKKKYLSHYANKYKADLGQGVNIDRKTLVQNADSSIEILKSFGFKIKPQDIRISGLGKNQAAVEIIYNLDFTKASPFANDRSINEMKDKSQGFFLTLEKINSRWLIISSERLIVKSPEKLPVIPDQKPAVAAISNQDKQFFLGFFNRHLDALNRKNLHDYLATLDPKSPQYKKTKEETVQLFKDYTLKYAVQSVKIISLDRNKQEAVVEMVATVQKVSGSSFKDSKIITTNVLKKNNGKWQVFDTSIDSLTNLAAKK
jgi:hypothetical protein